MPPEALTSEIYAGEPRHCRLSLQVCADALEAVVRPLDPATGTDADFLYRRIPYTVAADTPARALEEAVYANPLLVAPFARTDVLLRTPGCMVLPADADADTAVVAAALMGIDSPQAEPLVASAGRLYSVAAMVDRAVLGFVRRTFDTARTVAHPMAVLMRWFASRSALGNSGKVYVNLRPDSSDILVYNHLGPAGAVTVGGTSLPDTIYYIMAMASAAGLQGDRCEVHLAGMAERRAALAAELGKYLPAVVPAIIPSALLAMGRQALAAPLELSILPLCE